MLAILAEFWAFLRVRKKYWLVADRAHARHLRRPDHSGAGIGHCAVHLHVILVVAICAFSVFPPSITTAPPRWSSTAASSPRRRRSASRARSTTRGFPANAIAYCLAEARRRARRRRLRRVLREAVPEIRTAARDLSRLRAARLPVVSPWRSRCGSAKSCFRKTCSSASLQDIDPISTGPTGSCSPSIT